MKPTGRLEPQPWMDTTLGADERTRLLLGEMTQDEKFQMLRSYFGLGKDGGPLPEGAVGSAGFVPGVARLGIPSQQSADAGVGVTNPGGIRPGDFATAMPSGPSTASTWNRGVETQFKPLQNADVAGDYALNIGGKALTLNLSGALGKVEGKVQQGEKEAKLENLSVDKQQVLVHFINLHNLLQV